MLECNHCSIQWINLFEDRDDQRKGPTNRDQWRSGAPAVQESVQPWLWRQHWTRFGDRSAQSINWLILIDQIKKKKNFSKDVTIKWFCRYWLKPSLYLSPLIITNLICLLLNVEQTQLCLLFYLNFNLI